MLLTVYLLLRNYSYVRLIYIFIIIYKHKFKKVIYIYLEFYLLSLLSVKILSDPTILFRKFGVVMNHSHDPHNPP
jgi:hypothetical protein